MLRRAAEDHHHTEDDIGAYLLAAHGILSECGVDPETHDATLAAVLGLLASKQMVYEQMQPTVLGTLR